MITPILTDPAPQTVRVELGARSYDVVVGARLLASVGARARASLPRGRAMVITDDNVAPHHLEAVSQSLSEAELEPRPLILPAGEATKSWNHLGQVCDHLLAQDIERGEAVIALGGGVIGDLVGFAAAITKRGVPFIQIPTTLLAQVDSSVGGKTAINAAAGKNLIGAFHQPVLVLADIDVLNTLPDRDRRAGFAEILKIAAVADAAFFAWLEDHVADVLTGAPGPLIEAISRSVALKARIVAEDEREAGRRALLNLGHTFGHAFEAEAGYSADLRHGEAVAAGCVLAAQYSLRAGLCDAATAERLTALIAAADLPAASQGLPGAPFDAGRIFARMANDKKVERAQMRLVLLSAIGAGLVHKVTDDAVLQAFLKDVLV